MARLPEYNPKIYRNFDWDEPMQYLDGNNNAVNFTGFSLSASAYNFEQTKKYVDITCTITDAANGKFNLSLTKTQTASLPDKGYYTLCMTEPSGKDKPLFTGYLDVERGYK